MSLFLSLSLLLSRTHQMMLHMCKCNVNIRIQKEGEIFERERERNASLIIKFALISMRDCERTVRLSFEFLAFDFVHYSQCDFLSLSQHWLWLVSNLTCTLFFGYICYTWCGVKKLKVYPEKVTLLDYHHRVWVQFTQNYTFVLWHWHLTYT